MKKIAFILLLTMMLGLCACGAENNSAPPAQVNDVESTPEPTPEPEWEPATVRYGNAEVLWDTFSRGDKLTVLGRWEYYCVVSVDDLSLLVDSSFVRLDTEAPFEEADAYARSGALVFAEPSFADESKALAELKTNTKLRVLDGKDGWRLVEWEGGTGYIPADSVSSHYIDYSWSGGGNNGGNGGSQGADGGDIPLAYRGYERPKVQLLSEYSGPEYMEINSGTVLCDGTEAYLTVYTRGTTVKLVEYGEDECTILVGDRLASIPSRFLGAESAEGWTGFAKSNAVVYKEHQLRTELYTLNRNDEVKVIDKLEETEIYVVAVNGEVAYMTADSVSTTEIYDNYAPGGSGGGGTQEWTTPVL